MEGLSVYIGGYNTIYMQLGGKDEYFFSSLTHEVGHALENGIDTELIHIHFSDGTAMNIDGSVHDAMRGAHTLTNSERI